MTWLSSLVLVLALGFPALAPAQVIDTDEVPGYPNYPQLGEPRGPAIGPTIPSDLKRERLVAGLSTESIGITATFTGSEILIYGAVARVTPPPFGRPLDIIVTVEGPSESIAIRKKERVLGIWANTQSVSVASAPGFYAVATTGPLDEILDPVEDTRYRISIPLVVRALGAIQEVADTIPFTEALLRIRGEEGSYRLEENTVKVSEQTLFQTEIGLPAQLIEGDYKTRIFLLRDGKVLDVQRAAIRVKKVGLERWLYRLSLDKPLIYGILSLILAVAAGWGASAAFDLIRRK